MLLVWQRRQPGFVGNARKEVWGPAGERQVGVSMPQRGRNAVEFVADELRTVMFHVHFIKGTVLYLPPSMGGYLEEGV